LRPSITTGLPLSLGDAKYQIVKMSIYIKNVTYSWQIVKVAQKPGFIRITS